MRLTEVTDNIVKRISYQRYSPMIERFVKESLVILEEELVRHEKNYRKTKDSANWIMNNYHSRMTTNIKKAQERAKKDFFEWEGDFLPKDKLSHYVTLRKTILDNTENYLYNKINKTKGGK